MGGWGHEGNQTQAEADQGVRAGANFEVPTSRKEREIWGTRWRNCVRQGSEETFGASLWSNCGSGLSLLPGHL